jgi:hypothetical protein
LLIIRLGLPDYLIRHFEPSKIVRAEDLVVKAFSRIKATEGLLKKSEELVGSLADQQLDFELLAVQ